MYGENQREKIHEMYVEFCAFAQFATMWSPVETWLQAQAMLKGQPIPHDNDPESDRPGAPIGASFRWLEMCGTAGRPGPPDWFYRELGIGTVDSYFGPKQRKLRGERIKQIAKAAKEAVAEARREAEDREILKRTLKV